MHFIDYPNNGYHLVNTKNTSMHDLYSNYTKVFQTLKQVAKEYFVFGYIHRFYPNPPRMSDLS